MNDPGGFRNGSQGGGLDRRDLLKLGAAAAAGLVTQRLGAAEPEAGPARSAAGVPWNPATAGSMPTRNLGRTGHLVGIFSLGGQAARRPSSSRTTRRWPSRSSSGPSILA